MNESLHFLKPYMRGWPLIVLSMLAAYVVATKYLTYVTPMYESTARLRLADIEEGIPNSNLYKDFDVFATTQKVNAEIEMIKSHLLLSKALDKLNFDIQIFRVGKIRKSELYSDSPILVKLIEATQNIEDKYIGIQVDENYNLSLNIPGGTMIEGSFGDTLDVLGTKLVIELNHDLLLDKSDISIVDNYLIMINSRRKLISDLLANLDVSPVDKDIAVVRISYKSAHPQKAAILPNALAEAYIRDYIENKQGAAGITVEFLDERIEEISKKLSQVEDDILNYRNEKGITNIRQETETDLRKISQLKIQQTNLKMSLDAIRELEAYIEAGKENFLELAPNFEAFTDLLSTELVKNIMQLQADKKDLMLMFTPKDERVQVVDKKIKDLTRYLEESIRNTRRNLEIKYNNLANDIQLAELTFVDLPQKERTLTILNREFEIYQQTYNFLNEKRIEAEIAKAARIAFHRLITPASLSKTPVSPNYTIIKIVAAMLGMFGAIMLIFVVHALKARVNNRMVIEQNSLITLVAEVPKLKKRREEEKHFLQMLAQLEVKGLMLSGGITCLNGFKTREGSKYIIHNLFKTYELQERKVLLIDFHSLVFPTLNNSLEPVQLNSTTWAINIEQEAIKHLSSAALKSLIRQYADGFEQVLVLNDHFNELFAITVMSASDLNLVVVDARLTPAKNIQKVDLIKEEFDLPNMLFVLNRAGYNPSIIREVLLKAEKCFESIKLKS
jgi:uncharacterized protein involved in exopolysaccharide biosynthesis